MCFEAPFRAVFSKPAEIHQAPLQLSTIPALFRNIPISRQHRCNRCCWDMSQRHYRRPENKAFIQPTGLAEVLREKLPAESQTSDRNLMKARPRPRFKWTPPPTPTPPQAGQPVDLNGSNPRAQHVCGVCVPKSAGRTGHGADGREAILAEETVRERKTAKEEIKGAQGREERKKSHGFRSR